MFLLEHEWSPAIAGNAAQSMQAGATPCSASARLLAQALLVAGAGFAPEAIEQRLALGVELLDGQHRDVAVLGIDPRVRGPGAEQARAGQRRHELDRTTSSAGSKAIELWRGTAGRSAASSTIGGARYFPRAARSSSTKRSTASSSASRG